MIELAHTSRIYVITPFRYETGGTEALHQLAHKLNLFGCNCLTIYKETAYGPILCDGTPNSFKRHYLIREADRIDDIERNVVVVPEIWTRLLNGFKRIRKCIWWLSVDNNLNSPFGEFDQWSDDILHLFQSNYAKNYAESKNGKGYYLGEYIHRDFISITIEIQNKENIVLYNPAKGLKVAQKIMNKIKNEPIKFIALQAFDRSQLKGLFERSKVYIDFGHHPGMDRIPREAVVNGCCIIVGRNGAARFYDDVPVLEKYRLDDTSIDDICRVIRECVYDYEKQVADFSDYVEFVKNQELRMEIDLRSIFKKAATSETLFEF